MLFRARWTLTAAVAESGGGHGPTEEEEEEGFHRAINGIRYQVSNCEVQFHKTDDDPPE
jgi:hypothetical protein